MEAVGMLRDSSGRYMKPYAKAARPCADYVVWLLVALVAKRAINKMFRQIELH
ncbi:hypothetical protein HMPREF0322_03893 [Desulfitobacterium hafniense DP7]|uniref:Uncharacterized protein n=1 Tax=Desulfitobacterium hafniense DP7 TaxID=537010 RepID=G9XSE4_DESHA|nr:hypothetical protein HMPREF0322_03893 [Desulfitobacterium hafniense DP7]